MSNIILLEHFTSQSNINLYKDREILKEALNISNSIIKNFINNHQVKRIFVIRNEKFKSENSEKIKILYTNPKTGYIDILKKLNTVNKVLIIAPETKKLSIKLHSSIPKKFDVMSSTKTILKTFASKTETINILEQLNIPTVNFYKSKTQNEEKVIIKPNYGAGSDKIFIRKNNFLNIDKNYIVQRFYKGTKGSFLMLCKSGESKVVCCNEQILEHTSNKIRQIGCIMGGLEDHRDEIEALANKLCKKFKGLFGLIGVDIVREGGKWLILEINSRFTSSYCGLEKSYDSRILREITEFYINRKLKKSIPKFIKTYKYYF